MAKTRAKKKAEEPKPEAVAIPDPPTMDPKRVHELLGVMAPLDPPKEPPGFPDWSNWWDCGMSINALRTKQYRLYYPTWWWTAHTFAKTSESWCWRQLKILPPEPLDRQLAKLRKGDEEATAREVVLFLATHFLLTGERKEVRVRTRDKLPDLRRVVVSFTRFGFDISAVSDEYTSPTLGLAASFTPRK